MAEPSRSFPVAAFLSLVLAALLLPRPTAAQTATVSADRENLRQEPMGKRLATVNGGTRLDVLDSDGRWRQVKLRGWIWTPSVSATDRPGWDLAVSADGGENLRAEPGPNARIAARLLEGFLLTKLGEEGNWTRVERTAWMWRPSLRIREEASGADDAAAGGAGEEDGAAAGVEAGGDRLVVEETPVRLRRSPTGDTVGTARPGADLEVVGRQDDWVRVRLEAWVRASAVVPSDSAAVSEQLTPAELRANPGRHQGRRVRWTVQFISLERAGSERPDFYEGEPFVLARPAPGTAGREGGSGGFVYLAVPSELLDRVKALSALQTIDVVARVRTGRSALMGAPVLDLLELWTES